jgi:hypothetical protein
MWCRKILGCLDHQLLGWLEDGNGQRYGPERRRGDVRQSPPGDRLRTPSLARTRPLIVPLEGLPTYRLSQRQAMFELARAENRCHRE